MTTPAKRASSGTSLGDHEQRIRRLEAVACASLVVAAGNGSNTVTLAIALPVGSHLLAIGSPAGSGVTDDGGNTWTTVVSGVFETTLTTGLGIGDTITMAGASALAVLRA